MARLHSPAMLAKSTVLALQKRVLLTSSSTLGRPAVLLSARRGIPGQRAQRSVSHQRVAAITSIHYVAAAAAQTPVPVRIVVPRHQLQFGEQLKCVGESTALGNWYCNAAPFLSWTEGHDWVHTSQLLPGVHEFKLVIVGDSGSVIWEGGENRAVEIPEGGVEGVVQISCHFGDTANTQAEIVDASILDEVPSTALEPTQQSQEQDTGADFKPEEAAQVAAEHEAVLESPDNIFGVSPLELEGVAQAEPESLYQEQEEVYDEGVGMAEEASHFEEEETPIEEEQHNAYEPQEAAVAFSAQPEEPAAAPQPAVDPIPSTAQPIPADADESFKLLGIAKAAVLGQDSVIVSFSDSDSDEDAATIAERLLLRLNGDKPAK